jgi:hypothetical protein
LHGIALKKGGLMFKVIGINEILSNLIRLTQVHITGKPNKQTLHKAYHKFLGNAQPAVPKPEDINLSFKWKKEDVFLLLEIFKEDSVLDDFDEIFDKTLSVESNSSIEQVKSALKSMQDFSSSFTDLINLVIHTIFSFPSKLAGGGSTSAAIGCIWVDVRDHWNQHDILEFLVHETTHNLVFIDELCYTHYKSYEEIAKKENFAQSAILNKPRPLDKVFHSILVSTEVLLFRKDHFGHPNKPCLHPPTEILLDQTCRSLNSISDKKELLTNRAQFLLKGCENKLKTIESSLLCGA